MTQRIFASLVAAITLSAAACAPTMTEAQGDAAAEPYLRTYYCARTNQTLRVIFDEADGVARINRFGQPDLTLPRAEAEGGFRYANATYALAGDESEAQWSVGRARPVRCTGR